jgi:hypothetical protein
VWRKHIHGHIAIEAKKDAKSNGYAIPILHAQPFIIAFSPDAKAIFFY